MNGIAAVNLPLLLGEVAPKEPERFVFCKNFCKSDLLDSLYAILSLSEETPEKTTGEEHTMKEYEMHYVGSHVEVYGANGSFLFSADTMREAMEELDREG